MHLAEGVLNAPTLAACGALAAAAVAYGLHRLTERKLPLAALLGAAFFVAGTVHVPVGVGSVHLVLNGLAGLLLGWAVFPVVLVGLLLQAALFSFGGFAVLGANVLILATPGLVAHLLLRGQLRAGASRARLAATGALAGVIGLGGAALIAGSLLAATGGRAFADLIALLVAAHLPVLAVDALIGALTVVLLARMLPGVLRQDAAVEPPRKAAAAMP
jgi:cobalt/nickel transport system permease protein